LLFTGAPPGQPGGDSVSAERQKDIMLLEQDGLEAALTFCKSAKFPRMNHEANRKLL